MLLPLLAVAPAIIIALLVILKDRYEPEPRLRLIGAFLAGGVSVGLVLLLSHLLGDQETLLHSASTATRLLAWITFVGLVEELAKFIALSPFALSAEADEPVDFVVYGVLVALGFATVENICYLCGYGLEVSAGRAILSVPAHAVCGALMGLLLYHARLQARGLALSFLATIIPGIVHGVWDFLLSVPSFTQLLVVPFHLALIASGLIILESTALASPYRFRPKFWNRDPVHSNPHITSASLTSRLRRSRASLWLFHLLGIAGSAVAVALVTPNSLVTFVLILAGTLLLLTLVQVHGNRDRRLIDLRRLVPAEAGGLSPDELSGMLLESARRLRRPGDSTLHVILEDTAIGARRDWRRMPRDRRHLEAVPIAACRILEPGDLQALLTQRMALSGHLGRLPLLGWAAPVIVTLTVAMLAVQTDGLVAMLALLLWPAILVPFRLLEARLIESVTIGAVHLADLDAARVDGVEAMANALLKLGAWADRQLLLEVRATDLARAGELDPVILGAAVAGAREGTALDGTCLDDAARDAGKQTAAAIGQSGVTAATEAPDGSGELQAPAMAGERQAPDARTRGHGRRRRGRFSRHGRPTRAALRQLVRINWRDYDTRLRDGRLDRQELAALGERLAAEPDLPLFASGAFPEGAHSSPTIRDRLLCMLANAPPGASDKQETIAKRDAASAATPAG